MSPDICIVWNFHDCESIRRTRGGGISCRSPPFLVILAICLLQSTLLCCSLSIDPILVCEVDPNSRNEDVYVCSFRVELEDTSENKKDGGGDWEDPQSFTDSEVQQFLSACPTEGLCIDTHVKVRLQEPSKIEASTESQDQKIAVPDSDSSSVESLKANVDATTTNDHDTAEEVDVTVGVAHYHSPYSQYGPAVQAVLARRHDSQYDDVATSKASWFTELGNAHLKDVEMHSLRQATMESRNDDLGTWYHAELAINAYKQALIQIQNHYSTNHNFETTNEIPVHLEVLAAANFQLGEAYSVGFNFEHLDEALEHYQTAKDLYGQLRLEYSKKASSGGPLIRTIFQVRIPSMDKAFAESCTKVGMVVTNQALQNSNVQSSSVSATGPSIVGTTVDLLDGLGPAFGGAAFGDLFGGGDSMIGQTMSIEELLAMMQDKSNNQNKEEMEEQLQEASVYLDEAIMIYEQYLNNKDSDVLLTKKDRHDWQVSFAVACVQASTIASSSGNLVRARQFLDKGVDLYREYVLPYQEKHDESTVATSLKSIGDLYISLADTNLQLGDYDTAKSRYHQSMEWHRDRNVELTPFATYYGDESMSQMDESITLIRQQLDEYRRLVKAGTTGGAGGLYYIQQDDEYEGDLISALGAMHLSKGDVERAVDMFEQALGLYQNSGSSERKNQRTTADTKISLASAYFRARKFEKSEEMHFQALDIYQALYGNGVNPYTHSMDGIEEMLEAVGLGDFAEKLKILLQGGSDANDIPKVTVDMEQLKAARQNISISDDEVDKAEATETTSGKEEL